MKGKSFTRMLVTAFSVMALVLAFAPASFAGEDDGNDESSTPAQSSGGGGGGGGSDTGSASGGAQTGFGGMTASANGGMMLPFTLASGGVVVLSLAGGLASRRRRLEQPTV
jgi:hypothetical protein